MTVSDPTFVDYKNKNFVELLDYVREKKAKIVYYDLGDTLVHIPESIKLQIVEDINAVCDESISVAKYDHMIKMEWKRRENWFAKKQIKSVKTESSEIAYWENFFDCALNSLKVKSKAPQIITRLAYIQADPNSFEPYPYVLETLRRLKEMGIRIGIISNAFPSARKILEHTGLIKLFDKKRIILSCEYNSIKPEADIYKKAISKSGVEATEIVFIDDRESFLGQAVKLEMNALIIKHGMQTYTPLAENRDGISITSFRMMSVVFMKTIEDIQALFPVFEQNSRILKKGI